MSVVLFFIQRQFWYTIHTAFEKEFDECNAISDCPSQFKGFTIVNNLEGIQRSQFKRELIQRISGAIQDILPAKVGAIRIVHQPWFTTAIWTVVSFFLKEKLKSRIEFIGDDIGKLTDLISLDNLPEDLGGSLKWDHVEWMKSKGIKVNASTTSSGVAAAAAAES